MVLIGSLAEVTDTPIATIRFYEREGLLPDAQRADSNYRLYTAAHTERLSFIRHCRNLDMTLDEIRSLLRIKDGPPEDCSEVNTLLDTLIGHVAHRIRELRALEKNLKELRARCLSPHSIDECGILNGLDSAAAGGAAAPRPRLTATFAARTELTGHRRFSRRNGHCVTRRQAHHLPRSAATMT